MTSSKSSSGQSPARDCGAYKFAMPCDNSACIIIIKYYTTLTGQDEKTLRYKTWHPGKLNRASDLIYLFQNAVCYVPSDGADHPSVPETLVGDTWFFIGHSQNCFAALGSAIVTLLSGASGISVTSFLIARLYIGIPKVILKLTAFMSNMIL